MTPFTGGFATVGLGKMEPDLTHLVAVGPGQLLFYDDGSRSGTIRGAVRRVLPVGLDTAALSSTYGKWTHVTATSAWDVFFYDADTGAAYVSRWSKSGGLVGRALPKLDAGWSHIVASGNGMLFFYSSNGGPALGKGTIGLGRLSSVTLETLLYLDHGKHQFWRVAKSSGPKPLEGVPTIAVGGSGGLGFFYSPTEAHAEAIGTRLEPLLGGATPQVSVVRDYWEDSINARDPRGEAWTAVAAL